MRQNSTKITVDLGSVNLYKAVKILAIERGVTLRDVVVEALRDWVEKQEELEDIQALEEAKGEPTTPIEELLAELGESELLHKNR